MSVISFEGVTKTFPSTGEVLRPLHFEIPKGQFVSILGPSGCGKSTLLRMIAGLEVPTSGTVRVSGNPRIGFVFQEAQLLPWRSVLENVLLPLELNPNLAAPPDQFQNHQNMARQALIRVGLGEALAKKPHQLSGGMKMRVSVARALVTKPDILLLDEPFSALDEVTRFRLQEDLRSYWSAIRMTVVFVTHSMSEAAFVSDRQIVLSRRPAGILLDRVSKIGPVRDESMRLSAEYINEVRELQHRFRVEEEYP